MARNRKLSLTTLDDYWFIFQVYKKSSWAENFEQQGLYVLIENNFEMDSSNSACLIQG